MYPHLGWIDNDDLGSRVGADKFGNHLKVMSIHQNQLSALKAQLSRIMGTSLRNVQACGLDNRDVPGSNLKFGLSQLLLVQI